MYLYLFSLDFFSGGGIGAIETPLGHFWIEMTFWPAPTDAKAARSSLFHFWQ